MAHDVPREHDRKRRRHVAPRLVEVGMHPGEQLDPVHPDEAHRDGRAPLPRAEQLPREQPEAERREREQRGRQRRDDRVGLHPGRARDGAVREVDRRLGAPDERDAVDGLARVDVLRAVLLQELRGADGEVRVRAVADDRHEAAAEHRQQGDRADEDREHERDGEHPPRRRVGGRAARAQAGVATPREHGEADAPERDDREREVERDRRVGEQRKLERGGGSADRQHPQRLVAAQARRQEQAGRAPAHEAEQHDGRDRDAQRGAGAAAADDARVLREAERDRAGAGKAEPGEDAVAALVQRRWRWRACAITRLRNTGFPTR